METMNITFKYNNREKYPSEVIEGINQSLKQADRGILTPYTGIDDMLGKFA
jgi:hypothetical protein